MNKTFALAATLAAGVTLAPIAGEAALVSITGGTSYTTSTSGTAKNDVIGGNHTLLDNALLQTNSSNVKLDFYFLGSESGYTNTLTTAFGSHAEPANNTQNYAFPFGFPGQYQSQLSGVQTAAGTVQLNFTSPSYSGTIGNNSPILSGSTIIGSVAFAYLQDLQTFTISSRETNFILFGLDDGGANRDDNHDDYMGVIKVSQVPVPAALPLMLTALAGLGLIGRRRMQADA